MVSVMTSMLEKICRNVLHDYIFFNLVLTSLPQIYPTLITNDLYSYGTKMFPQFE